MIGDGEFAALLRQGHAVTVHVALEDEGDGWAGTRLVEPLTALAAALGAALVASGFGWWLHHTFVVPSRPRRTP